MCAAEHGHKEIVKLLLAQPDIDASLSDCVSSNFRSLSIVLQIRIIWKFSCIFYSMLSALFFFLAEKYERMHKADF